MGASEAKTVPIPPQLHGACDNAHRKTFVIWGLSMLYEFCAENFERVPAAIDAGARRIELCDNLAVGGTTPSAGVISATVSYAHEHDARVMCMIRPRGGDFHYNQDELRMMEMDLGLAVSAARRLGLWLLQALCRRMGAR